jgi:hypothetical protein
MMDIKTFVEIRNEALLSLDKEKILNMIKVSNPNCKIPTVDDVFWAGVHKARIAVVDFPENIKNESRDWLSENGFSNEIYP